MTPLATRRQFLAASVAALAAPLGAQAQQAGKVWRIGLLFAGDPALSPQLRGFYGGLRDLGYIEGRNLKVEVRAALGRYERLPALAAELAALKPDLIVTSATPAALAAKKATQTIPIVALVVGDPVASGLVANLGRPEANITGLSLVNPELAIKRLDVAHQLIPRATRIAVLQNSLNQQHERDLTGMHAAAESLRIRLQVVDARKPEDIERALMAVISSRTEALVALADSLFFSNRQLIIKVTRGHRVADVHPYREMAEEGALASYGLNLSEHYRRGAGYVDKVLRGIRPPDLPFEQPANFEFVINMKTARGLNLTIPQSLFLRADQVIE